MYQAFCNGGFVVQKTCRPFSATAHDQARELCNAIVKGNGGVVGLASSPGALKRWVTTGPQIACLLKSFEHSITSKCADCNGHHEQSPAPRKAFKINVQALVVSFGQAGNAFEDDGGYLFALDSKVIVDAAAMTAVSSVITSGIQQYNNCVEEKRTKENETNQKASVKEQAACVCATTEGYKFFPDNPPQWLLIVFAALPCMPDKERGPARIFQALKPANTTVIEQTG